LSSLLPSPSSGALSPKLLLRLSIAVALTTIVLKGADLAAFWTDLGALGIFAMVMLALASLRLGRAWNVGG